MGMKNISPNRTPFTCRTAAHLLRRDQGRGLPVRRVAPTHLLAMAVVILLMGFTGISAASTNTQDLLSVTPERVNISSCGGDLITIHADVASYSGYQYGIKIGNACRNDNVEEPEQKPECEPGVESCCEVLATGDVTQDHISLSTDRRGNDLSVDRFVDCDGETSGRLTFTVVLSSIIGQTIHSTVELPYVLTRPSRPVIEEIPTAGESVINVAWVGDNTHEEFRACALDGDEALDPEVPYSEQTFELPTRCSSRTTAENVQITNLEVGVTFLVTVIGYDEAGNESLPATPMEVTTHPVTDFFEYYRESGGAEMGGYCATTSFLPGGPQGARFRVSPLLLLGVLLGTISLGRGSKRRRRGAKSPSKGRLLVSILALLMVGSMSTMLFPGEASARSPRRGIFDLRIGSYLPAIDDEFPDAAEGMAPYERYFGQSGMTTFAIDLGYHVYQEFGTVTAGIGIGYGSTKGHSFVEGTNRRSPESTRLTIIPLNTYLSYSLDFPALRWNFPLVPYAKMGLDYYLWRVLDGSGEVAISQSATAAGGVHGWHYALGVRFLLDVLSPGMARNFDNEFGINASYLTFEFQNTTIDGFGETEGMNLSAESFLFGLAFDF